VSPRYVARSTGAISFAFALVFVFSARADRSVAAQPAAPTPPAPAASPAPAPTASGPARPLGLRVSLDANATYVDQSTNGPGRVGPEAAGFIAGSPLAPNTPYDLFSSAPDVPGIAGVGELLSTATYGFRAFDASVSGGFGYANGSVTNAAYWGESLFPTLDPHLGSLALPYRIAFPTHAGEDDGTTGRASLTQGRIATADGNASVRGGWFDLAQTDRFVFAQPALTSVDPAIGFAPAESVGNGLPNLDDWSPIATQLPLHGIDGVAKRGDATLELTDAALPSLPGESARMTMGSLVFDRGEGTRFSAELLHVTTSGVTFLSTVPFGGDPAYVTTPQGILPTSVFSGQRQTVAGLRGAFHIASAASLDGLVEIGRAWYDASDTALPGTAKPGGYYHAAVTETHGRVTAGIDVYRVEPRYATAILPYGIPENQWSAAFAWPGQWLKSNYQLIDNSIAGVNREGYVLRYALDHGPLDIHASYTDLRQIEPETTLTAEETGYVDGYYLPQLPPAATFGRQKRFAFWSAYHTAIGDLSLDIVDDELFRPAAAGFALDGVSYEVPQAVLGFSHAFSKSALVSVDVGRYAMDGRFSEPIDFAERLFSIGAEIKESPRSSLLADFRRTAFGGLSTAPAAGLSPNFTGSLVVVEQRIHL
jgi:hypothetical protein